MAEEFQESEVIFSDYWDHENSNSGRVGRVLTSNTNNNNNNKVKNMKKKNKPSSADSVPVNINITDSIFQCPNRGDLFEEGYEDGEIEPPHVIIGRRIAGKMAFSVCTGNGRTLKGRDLSQVRNSILRMTGFLET